MWKLLSREDRHYWDDVADKDKQRYMLEKASYNGPWQIPFKRAKKDPSAPRRPMSAFLLWSIGMRQQVKEANPTIKNTEVSKILGDIWKKCTYEERRPHIEKEKVEREKYKLAMAEWKIEFEKRKEEERKLEQQKNYQLPFQQYEYAQNHSYITAGRAGSHMNSTQQKMQQFSKNTYLQHSSNVHAPYQAPGFMQYPSYGKILGPDGMPRQCQMPLPPPPQPSQQHHIGGSLYEDDDNAILAIGPNKDIPTIDVNGEKS